MVAMQHFGCPTRLLDWTWSPYVAAYFALTEAAADHMAIYCLDVTSYQGRLAAELPLDDYDGGLLRWIPTRILKRFLAHEPEIAPIPFWPEPLTEREFHQKSVFLLDPRLVGTTQSRLAEAAGKDLVKLILPPAARIRGLSDLKEMNIDGLHLFQGTGGVARLAREQLFGVPERGRSLPLIPER